MYERHFIQRKPDISGKMGKAQSKAEKAGRMCFLESFMQWGKGMKKQLFLKTDT